MNIKVFISYSSVDGKQATKLAKALDEIGIDYFLDKKRIDWDDNFTDRIIRGLAECSVLIVIISPASLKSQWVSFEIGHASGQGKKILPFLTHSSLDLPDYLRNFHHETSLTSVKRYFESLTSSLENDLTRDLLKEDEQAQNEHSKLQIDSSIVPPKLLVVQATITRATPLRLFIAGHEGLRSRAEGHAQLLAVTLSNSGGVTLRSCNVRVNLEFPFHDNIHVPWCIRGKFSKRPITLVPGDTADFAFIAVTVPFDEQGAMVCFYTEFEDIVSVGPLSSANRTIFPAEVPEYSGAVQLISEDLPAPLSWPFTLQRRDGSVQYSIDSDHSGALPIEDSNMGRQELKEILNESLRHKEEIEKTFGNEDAKLLDRVSQQIEMPDNHRTQVGREKKHDE